MGLLDRLERSRQRAQKAAAERRVKAKAAENKRKREREKRRRRLEAGEPEGVRETAQMAGREVRGLGGDIKELISTAGGSQRPRANRAAKSAKRAGEAGVQAGAAGVRAVDEGLASLEEGLDGLDDELGAGHLGFGDEGGGDGGGESKKDDFGLGGIGDMRLAMDDQDEDKFLF